ncbi:hypothetical protein [Roseisalinus antarcticus]|uniref:Uncharacterized protein n=1 Tax=Roseisalinus antarcticus TaxID=254357 RepID=A0A1Y5TLK7_9RHOB|nr:hypothetical protein [Roseisalinus antarcticus]SLN66927.1 hypothetical protein ROA7023_03191 [Roseisalinus antarcticus]
MIATSLGGIVAFPWARAALRYGTIAIAIALFLLSARRSGERACRIAERLDIAAKADKIQRGMLEAAAGRPPDRNALVDRLRNGAFLRRRA